MMRSSVIESRKMSTTAHKVIRGVGNRSARGRSKRYQQRTEYPRGMVISTAELLLPGQSDVGRMLNYWQKFNRLTLRRRARKEK